MGEHQLTQLWTVDDVARYLNVSRQWVYERTSIKSRKNPKIPRISNLSILRFDPKEIMSIFAQSSLKTTQTGKIHSSTPKQNPKKKGGFELL